MRPRCELGRLRIRGRVVFALAVGGLLLSSRGVSAGDRWLPDLDEGRRLAAARGKDLLINFTGTAWCAPCVELEYDIFEQPEFEPVSEHFVLVRLDFPASEEDLPPELREKYVAWKERYGIRAFPTVILADATGRPYALTGNVGLGPDDYVRHLSELRTIRERRDAALSEASRSQGLVKARHLDKALSALREGFGSRDGESMKEDSLVRFYRPQIEQLLALAGVEEGAALRDTYQDVLEAERERGRIREIDERLQAIQDEEGLDAAIGFVDRELARARTPEPRNQLRLTRLILLEWANRHEEALSYAEQCIEDDSYSSESRRWFRERMAYDLEKLGRIDEAVAMLDAAITAGAGDPETTRELHETKARLLARTGRFREALETWETASRGLKPGTLDWSASKFFRADLMMRLGWLDDAVAVLDALADTEGVDALDRAGALAEAALLLSKAGRHREALERTRLAEASLAGAEPSNVDLPIVEVIRGKIEAVRADAP